MRKAFVLAITCFMLLLVSDVFGQKESKRPKVGLVLSGGGAKGIAHIALLKAIDSLGIKVDYVTGTSMGSVVGALYASGYKGKEIEALVRDLDWDQVLSNKVQFQNINIEEKDEFGIYQAEIPTKDRFKPTLPLGIIEGQALTNKLTEYLFHVRYVEDFDSLPIPFRCMAADVLSGEPVVMKSGNLPIALRSSMSIPTVFVPIEMDTMLLVDGGLVKNFPVSLCKEMGADIIIGAYTGGKLYGKEEMTSMLKLLYQTSSFVRLEDSEAEKALCDVLVNSNAYLDGYGANDFNKAEKILAQGQEATQAVLGQLIRIANDQKQFHVQPVSVDKRRTNFRVSNIDINGVSNQARELAQGKFGMDPGSIYDYNDVYMGIQKVYGTRFYEKIIVDFSGDSAASELNLIAPPRSRGEYKMALHYDNYQYAGVILNYTARDLFVPASRTLFTLDFAENPKGRIKHYNFLGQQKKYWVSGEVLYDRVYLTSYNRGSRSTIYINNYLRYNLGMHYSITRSAAWGLNGGYEYDQVFPEVKPENMAFRAAGLLSDFVFGRWNAAIRYDFNKLSHVYFPEKGSKLFFMAKGIFSPLNRQSYLGSDSLNSLVRRAELMDPIMKLQFEFERNRAITESITWRNQFFAGMMFNLPADDGLTPLDPFQSENFFLGGVAHQPRLNGICLMGYHAYEYNFPQFISWQTNAQLQLTHNLYAIANVNFTAAGHDPLKFMSSIYKLDFNFNDASQRDAVHEVGYGLRFAVRSRLGPVQFGVGSTVGAPRLRYFWGFGYTLQ